MDNLLAQCSNCMVDTDSKVYKATLGSVGMRKLRYNPRTIDDETVRDGLCAISALDDLPASRDQCFVVGGIATQSYLPTSCRRPTSDIDLAVLRPLTHDEFRGFSGPVQDSLRAKGYTVETKKDHSAYKVFYVKPGEEDAGQAGVIEFVRRGPSAFGRMEQRLQREFDHTRKKLVEGRNATYRVSSPEDIAVPKMVRGIGSLERNRHLTEYLGRYISEGKKIPLSDEEIKRSLEEIEEIKQDAILHLGDPRVAERLRFVSDLFDIRILSEVVGFNEPYLVEAMRSWDRLQKDRLEKELLLKSLFPNLASQA